jgi:hypothetical protein
MSATPELEAAAVAAMATELDSAQAKSATASASCLNCAAPLAGPFCSSCGQKAAPVAPTLGLLVHEVVHEVLNVDGKIFRSLRLLLTRPGFLTREIFAGKRASYVAPLRLYLVASVLAFAMSALFGTFGDVNFSYTPGPGEQIDAAMLERTAATRSLIQEAINVWMPRALFVLVPLFAALVMLFRRGSGHTYPQHLYFALHVHAAWFFANALDSLIEGLSGNSIATTTADLATELYMVAYLPLAFRRAYETELFAALWRSLLIALLYFVVVMVTLAGIAAPVAWSLLFGGQP